MANVQSSDNNQQESDYQPGELFPNTPGSGHDGLGLPQGNHLDWSDQEARALGLDKSEFTYNSHKVYHSGPNYFYITKKYGLVKISNPNLSKAAYMSIVYPAWDNPVATSPLTASTNLTGTISQSMPKTQAQQQDQNPNDVQMPRANLQAIAQHPDEAASDLINMSQGKYGQEQAWMLIQLYLSDGGVVSPSAYYNLLANINPRQQNADVALSLSTGKSDYNVKDPNDMAKYQYGKGAATGPRLFFIYENRLFNFYADDSKYTSGEITCTGRLGVEYGKRLIWFDQRRRYAWEFYVDGVAHHFDYQTGWTTTIQVERGLPFTFAEAEEYFEDPNTQKPWTYDVGPGFGKPIKGNFTKRFEMFWGHGVPFVGGFFGEQTLNSIVDQANEREKAYLSRLMSGRGGGSVDNQSDNKSTSKLVNAAVSLMNKYPKHGRYGGHGTYQLGARNGAGDTDCAGFVWYAMKKAGYQVPSTVWATPEMMSLARRGHILKQVPASKTQSGSVVICQDHTGILEEHWHGADTRVIDDNEGENIIEEPYHQGFDEHPSMFADPC